jgi:hypothetical protein
MPRGIPRGDGVSGREIGQSVRGRTGEEGRGGEGGDHEFSLDHFARSPTCVAYPVTESNDSLSLSLCSVTNAEDVPSGERVISSALHGLDEALKKSASAKALDRQDRRGGAHSCAFILISR